MRVFSTYSKKIADTAQYRKVFGKTVCIYRTAVDFFIGVALQCWDTYFTEGNSKEQLTTMERLTVRTAKNPDPLFPFEAVKKEFYKFPAYLRRAAVNEAIGKVSSYLSNMANWKDADPRSSGRKPGYPSAGYVYPALYREGMYKESGTYTARIKVFIHNTWDWIDVTLNKGDVDYIDRHCKPLDNGNGPIKTRKICTPTLQKRGKLWYLDFPVEESVALTDVPAEEQIVLAVDLGINNACACAVMHSDGAVAGRKFLKLPAEYDSLKHAMGRIKKAQRTGATKTPRLWAVSKGINDDIAVKTAQFIIDIAVQHNASVIVMEHLDTQGKKRGSKKQRLHHWKCQYVQQMITTKAHRLGIRIAHVNAWGTSKLAFDGSGIVLRGGMSQWTNSNYSLCEFSNTEGKLHGKIYNCDLNAAYNIGARYFVRELIKTASERTRQLLEAKVPSAVKRSTCTLSTLISLNAVLAAAAAGN